MKELCLYSKVSNSINFIVLNNMLSKQFYKHLITFDENTGNNILIIINKKVYFYFLSKTSFLLLNRKQVDIHNKVIRSLNYYVLHGINYHFFYK